MSLPAPAGPTASSPDFLANATKTKFTGETPIAPYVDASPSTAAFTSKAVSVTGSEPTKAKDEDDPSLLHADGDKDDDLLTIYELAWDNPDIADDIDPTSEDAAKQLNGAEALFVDQIGTRVSNVIQRIIPGSTGKSPAEAAKLMDEFTLRLDPRYKMTRDSFVMLGRDMNDPTLVSEVIAQFLSQHPASPMWEHIRRAETDSFVEQRNPIDVIADLKGGPGSGYHGPRPSESDHDWGGSAPRSAGGFGGSDDSPRDSTPATPESRLRDSAEYRLEFRKRKLSREVLSHAAVIKHVSEKPFTGISDRITARKHMKAMKKKLAALDIPEAEVYKVLSELSPQDQAMMASAAKLEQSKSSHAKTVAKNVGRYMLHTGVEKMSNNFAPPLLTNPRVMAKMNPVETAAWMAKYDKPARAIAYSKALASGDIIKAHSLRQSSWQDVISNKYRDEYRRFHAEDPQISMYRALDNLSRHRATTNVERLERAPSRIRTDVISGARAMRDTATAFRSAFRAPGSDEMADFNAQRKRLGLKPLTRREFTSVRGSQGGN